MRGFVLPMIACLVALTGCPRIPVQSSPDAGPRPDAGTDAGIVAPDAGQISDGGQDAGHVDAGPVSCGLGFDYAVGYPCNSDADCKSHHCAFPLPGSAGAYPGVCSDVCADDGATDECLPGYVCTGAYSVSFEGPTQLSYGEYCIPTAGTATLPGDKSLVAGSPCWDPSDCAGTGAQCGSYNYGSYLYTFCAPTCKGLSDTTTCGGCASCQHPFSGAQDYCLYQGALPIGAPCVHHDDCASFLCEDFCTAPCSTSSPCPSGSVCEAFDQSGQTGSVCIAPSQLGGTADGDSCVFDFQCAKTSQCLQSPTTGQFVCTPLGTLGQACTQTAECTKGLDCRQVASGLAECTFDCGAGCPAGDACFAPDIATELRLYNSTAGGDNGYIAYANNQAFGQSNVWSSIVNYPVSPGTYWVSIRSDQDIYPNNYAGNYQLVITDAAGTPVVWHQLPPTPIPNNTLATAQVIPFPVDLEGTLDTATDVDDYEFTISQSDLITIKTLPGAPSACLPAAQVAGTGLGQSCTESFNCTAGLTCNTSLHICTMACAQDSDCGTGNSCEPSGSQGMLCAAASAVGQTANGGQCQFDWQCGSGASCVTYGTHSVCAVPCGTGMTCTASECTVAVDNTTRASLMACVPLGMQQAGFGQACVLQSDCVSGLTCNGGSCQQSCTTTSDCPFHPFAADPLVCKPCQDSGDCTTETEEGTCQSLGSNEQYCLFPCDSAGHCPTGLKCIQSYPLDLCAPADGSCHAPVCTIAEGASSGMCTVPPSAYAEGCKADADCTTGTCLQGLCSQACHADLDCACPTGDLTCSSGMCTLAATDVVSAGTNVSLGMAQQLAGALPITVLGSFSPAAGSAYYAVSLTAGQVINIQTSPVCGLADTGASNNIELFDPTNAEVAADQYSFRYADIHDYTVTTTGTFIIEIDTTSYSAVEPIDYILTIAPAG
jgi:hypothetical protein